MNKVLYLIFISFSSVYSQWLPDYRLTVNPFPSDKVYNHGTGIAAAGNSVYVIWYDRRDGTFGEIYFKRSTDGALTWTTDQRLTYDPASSVFPSIAVYNTSVHICWQEHRTGTSKTYYKNSTDNGVTWNADKQISFGGASTAQFPSIALVGNTIYTVWQDNRDGNNEIYFSKSTNGGANWLSEQRLTNNASPSALPSISASFSYVFVSWIDDRDGNKEIYFKKSTDSGSVWSPDQRLTNNTYESNYTSISSSGSLIAVTWQDLRDANWEIYIKRSTNNGVNWSADERLTNQYADSFKPSVTVSNSLMHVTWEEYRDGNAEIYYKRSSNSGLTWGSDIRLTVSNANSLYPSVAASNSAVNILWQDDREGNYEIYYKRDSTANFTGLQPVGAIIPKSYFLSQNYPNPFNPVTVIKFGIPVSGSVMLKIFDISGRVIKEIVNHYLYAGEYEVTWDAELFASGIYFYSIEATGFTATKKMILIK